MIDPMLMHIRYNSVAITFHDNKLIIYTRIQYLVRIGLTIMLK